MKGPLREARCFNHAEREAAARCPPCGRYFCRECVTEHEDRVICAACLAGLAKKPAPGRAVLAAAVRALQFLAALAALWLVFYAAGSALLNLPSAFHQGEAFQETHEDGGRP
jgi:hypothetical protein